MKVIDCYWEKDNINSNVVEIIIDEFDKFDEDTFLRLERDYDYIVVKVPQKEVEFYKSLSQIGYFFVESQIGISKKVKEFDYSDKLVRFIDKGFSSCLVDNENHLHQLLDSIDESMFLTDRITLDPYYGPKIGCNRYKKWITSEYYKGESQIYETRLNNKSVGFMMLKEDGKVLHNMLGGVFSKNGRGLGLITGCGAFLLIKNKQMNIEIVRSAISSNNMPVMSVCNYLNYNIDSLCYVFVKHN